MAKSDLPLKRIDCSKAYKEQLKPTHLDAKSINAFDTETCDGTVFMLSYAIEKFSGVIDNSDVTELDKVRIFEKITHRSCRNRNAINVWYNLDFDVNAILSGILTEEQIADLVLQNWTKTEIDGLEYKIDYVKGKFLFIEDEHSNKYEHYDISQFFYMSLDKAAEKWLNKTKLSDVDTSKFDDKDYIQSNYNRIKEYAERDAKITQELAQELIKEAQSLNIPFGKPFSTGYVAEEYKRENMESKPSFGSTRYQSMFWDAYAGGRFEVFERGDMGEIVAPDINSAYPAVMANLPDPDTLDWMYYANENDSYSWEESDGFNITDVIDADYGVVRARVTTDANERIQPFVFKHNDKVHFPALFNTEIVTIKPIFEFAVSSGIVTDYELKDGWLGNTTKNTEYPYDFIPDVYADRKEFEIVDDRPKKGKNLKIVLNSMYGKTCQTIEDVRIVEIKEGETYELETNEKLLPQEFLSERRRSYLDENEFIVATYRSGRHFNPFIASYITGMTRLKLHKSVHEYDLVEDTVMFATDCIIVRKNAYEKSNFDELIDVPNPNKPNFVSIPERVFPNKPNFRQQAKQSLGSWDFDYEGTGFIVGSGVYEVEKENGIKTKTRGFIESDLDASLRELAHEYPNGIPVTNNRPVTLAEMFTNRQNNVAGFMESTKRITAGFDSKRSWNRECVDFHDLLSGSEISEPITVENGKVMRMHEIDTERVERIKPHMPPLEYNPLAD